jgi:hypothetical protein
LPLSSGQAERHGFEYFRHGTLSLYVALNTAAGEALGTTANVTLEFLEFLSEVVATQPADTQIHIIADNLSTHELLPSPCDRRRSRTWQHEQRGGCIFIATWSLGTFASRSGTVLIPSQG